MNVEWEQKRLEEISEIVYGTRVVQKRDGGKTYPVYGGGGATFFMDTYNREDALIVGRFAMSEKCTRFIKGKFFLNDSGLTVRTKEENELSQEFLDWQLLSLNDLIYSISRGTAQRNLDIASFRNLKLSYPKSLYEQKRIVELLDSCFAAIDRAKAIATQNIKNAKELFESYLNGLFERKGEDWEEKRICDICKLLNGRAYNKQELLAKGKYRVLRVGNFFTNQNWYYSDLELDENKYCDKEDLLYAWSASFGPHIWQEGKVIYHYHIWKIIPFESIVARDYLYILLEWDKEKMKDASGTGTTMLHVSKGSMESRIVPIPPLRTQLGIVIELNALKSKTQKLEAHYQRRVASLDELKKSLLKKAFTGELTENVSTLSLVE